MAESNTVYSNMNLKGYRSNDMMTIPQIKNAKAIISKKLSEPQDALVVRKLNALLADYENSERKINKFFKTCSNHKDARVREFVRGKRNLLTVLDIKRVSRNGKFKDLIFKQKGEKWDYNAFDFLRDIKADKIALGLGVGAMGLGVASIKFGEKSLMDIIKTALSEFLKTNPAAFGLLVGGASMIALSKIVPAIDRKVRDIQRHKTISRAVQNEISAEQFKDISGFGKSSLGVNFERDREKVVSDLFNMPELRSYYEKELNSNNLSSLERKNLMSALTETYEKVDDLNRLADGRQSKSEEAQAKQSYNQDLQTFEQAKQKIDEFKAKTSSLSLENKAEATALQSTLKEISALSSSIKDETLKANLTTLLQDAENVFSAKLSDLSKEESSKNQTISSEIENQINSTNSNISGISESSTNSSIESIQNSFEDIKNKISKISDNSKRKDLEQKLDEAKKNLSNTAKNYGFNTEENSKEKKKISTTDLSKEMDESEKIKERIFALDGKLNNIDFNKEGALKETQEELTNIQKSISALKSEDVKKDLNEKLDPVKIEFENNKNAYESSLKDNTIKNEIEASLKPYETEQTDFTFKKNNKVLSPDKQQKLLNKAEEIKNPTVKNSLISKINKYAGVNQNNSNDPISKLISEINSQIKEMNLNNIVTIGQSLENLERAIYSSNATGNEIYVDDFNRLETLYISKRNILKNQRLNPCIKLINGLFADLNKEILELTPNNFESKKESISNKMTELSNEISESTTSVSHFQSRLNSTKELYEKKVSDFEFENQIGSNAKEIYNSLNNLDPDNKLKNCDIFLIDDNLKDLNKSVEDIEKDINNLKSIYGNDSSEIKNLDESLKAKKESIKKSYDEAIKEKENIVKFENDFTKLSQELKSDFEAISEKFNSTKTIDVEELNALTKKKSKLQSMLDEFKNDYKFYDPASKNLNDYSNFIDKLRKEANEKVNTDEAEKTLKDLNKLCENIYQISNDNLNYDLITNYTSDFVNYKVAFNSAESNKELSSQYQKISISIRKGLNKAKANYNTNVKNKIISELDDIKKLVVNLSSDLSNIDKNSQEINNKIENVKGEIKNSGFNDLLVQVGTLEGDYKKANEKKTIEEINLAIDNDNIRNLIENFDDIKVEQDYKYINDKLNGYNKKLNTLSESDDKALLESRIKTLKQDIDEKYKQVQKNKENYAKESSVLEAETLKLIENLNNIETYESDCSKIQENIDKIKQLSYSFIGDRNSNKDIKGNQETNSASPALQTIYAKFTEKKNAMDAFINDKHEIEAENENIQKQILGIDELSVQSNSIILESISTFRNMDVDSKLKPLINQYADTLTESLNNKNKELQKKEEIKSKERVALDIQSSLKNIDTLIKNVDITNSEKMAMAGAKLTDIDIPAIYSQLEKARTLVENAKSSSSISNDVYKNFTQELKSKENTLDDISSRMQKAEDFGKVAYEITNDIKRIRELSFILSPKSNFERKGAQINDLLNRVEAKSKTLNNEYFSNSIKDERTYLESQLSMCRKKAQSLENAENEHKQYQETGKVSENSSIEDSYGKLFNFKYKEVMDCSGYGRAVEKKQAEVFQTSEVLRDEIRKVIGSKLSSHDSSISINTATGEFSVEGRPDLSPTSTIYPEVTKAYQKFHKAVVVLNNLQEGRDQTNSRILQSKYNEACIRMTNKIAKTLNISKDEAKKLYDENGNLKGQASSKLSNDLAINDLKKQIREAKQEIENYSKLSNSEKSSKTIDILNYKLEDIKKTYNNMLKNIGKDGADRVCAKTCVQLNADIETMEKRLGSGHINTLNNVQTPALESKPKTETTVKKPQNVQDNTPLEKLKTTEVTHKKEFSEWEKLITDAKIAYNNDPSKKDAYENLVNQATDDYGAKVTEIIKKLPPAPIKENSNAKENVLTFNEIKSQIDSILKNYEQSCKLGLLGELDKNVSEINSLLNSSCLSNQEAKALRADTFKLIPEIKKNGLLEYANKLLANYKDQKIKNIDAQKTYDAIKSLLKNELPEKQKEFENKIQQIDAEVSKTHAQKENSKVTQEDIEELLNAGISEYYEVIEQIQFYDNELNSKLNEKMDNIKYILAEAESYYGKDYAEKLKKEMVAPQISASNKLKDRLPIPLDVKKLYTSELKNIVRNLKTAIEEKDNEKVAKLKNDYKQIIDKAKAEYNDKFAESLKSVPLKSDVLNEKSQDQASINEFKSSLDIFKESIDGLNTKSMEFKNFIKAFQNLYNTLSKENNERDTTSKTFEERFVDVNRSCTDKQIAVAKYLYELAQNADKQSRKETQELQDITNSKATSADEEKISLNNRIKQMVEDGLTEEEILKLYPDKKTLVHNIMKNTNEKLNKKKQEFSEMLEREL